MQTMKIKTWLLVAAAFLLGCGFGGVSLQFAQAQGLFGLTPTGLSGSISKIGTALLEMQKNVDALQQNMATVKGEKDHLASFLPEGTGKEGDAIKKLFPGLGK
jgi:hypothetical protein